MSAYHPELWQPSWSSKHIHSSFIVTIFTPPFLHPVRTALLAIIGFMPTDGAGAIGALDYPEGEKRRLAKLLVVIMQYYACVVQYMCMVAQDN